MAWTTTDRDNLKTAIAKGEKSVTYADRSVTYRSLQEMIDALALVEAELAQTENRPRQWYPYARKGL